MQNLEKRINWIIDSTSKEESGRKLKETRRRLDFLYAREESYWAQRSRSKWLREGDRNIRYFHAKATGRLKKNNIAKLKDAEGKWVTNRKDISKVAKDYFVRLFRSNGQNANIQEMGYIQECITRETNEWLNMDYTEKEVLQAIKQMDPNKAPGIDGLSGNFFKHHWDIVGNDTISYCLDVLNGSKNISNLNDTMIILIPKIKNPCELTNFRPISLCRFVYMIISKVLANRLKAVLPSCISQNQSAFVSGRMIHYNILIAHELLHYLQSSKNGPNKGLVVKLDMSKAYDRVEWNFFEKVMKKMGFEEKWIAKIMECVRSVTYTVKCNNILSDIFIPERGLHQGDPVSPYLFLFYMEAFSRMLIHAQENNTLRGIRASRDGPRINHLFFADDALLFVRNKMSDIECLVNMLNTFSNISVQEINFEKSMVLFSPNTRRAQRTIFSDLLGMPVVEKLNNYLGLPIPIGKKKTEVFKDIINKLSCSINSWTKRLLSFGGKEVFIKVVLQSIPTYAMSIFLAPKGVIEDIQAMLSRTWWSGKEKGRFWTMIPWKMLCKPKGMGGLGFRDVRLFNLALLGRQVWRILNNTDSLCFKVLSSKYFSDGDIFHAKKVDKASFTWSSIAAVVDVFKDGFGWRVDLMRVLDKRAITNQMKILWNCWNNRNNFIFRGKEEKTQLIWERASNLSKKFRICNMLNEPLILQNNGKKKWIKPPKGFIKIKFDATVGENRIGYGTVARDEEGFVVGGSGGFKEGRLSVEEAECVTFKESINVAHKLNLREDVLFETDNAGLVNRFNNLDNDVTILGVRIKECTAAFTIFKSAKLCWTERSCNSVAHLICKKMLRETKSCFFDMDYLSEIHDAVICDVT
ncbi:hypothetical protein PVK06_012533 [Gossypium arboreum]|uniref:Reverse transcriptase domain-containing protein n=1 Tax=Gossypium arboreum TaxID=29729 RepID=A0ABR0QCL8_GOSAR|nr:hypothetical protein PVK06_012533 [Gossypium arboreum]